MRSRTEKNPRGRDPGFRRSVAGPLRRTRAAGRWRRLARALRRVLAMPDYDAYLEHCRRAGHPARLTEREFVDEFFDRRGRTVRCC